MGSFSIVEFFATIAPLPILLPVIIGIRKYGYASQAEKHVVALVIVAFVSQLVATVLWWKTINNLFISHYFTMLEGLLLLRYFSFSFGKKGKMINVIALVFVGFSISQVFFSFPDLGINAAAKGVESALLVLVSLFVWRKIMLDYTEENLLSRPLFWINSAVLVYFSVGMLLFVFSESILSGKQSVGLSLWAIHLFFMTVYYSLLSVGLWKISRK